MPKCIGIVGSRRRDSMADFLLVRNKFNEIREAGDTVVSGGCPKGGDRFAESLARAHGLMLTIYYADWNGPDGKKAGFMRNTWIAERCDVLIACVAADRTGGTEDTVRKCLKLGKPVEYV